jgi:hypothetical protein
MKGRSMIVALSLSVLVAGVGLARAGEDKPKGPAMDRAAMDAMMKAMAPGENHKPLGRYVGDWTFTNQMWMDPSQPPMKSSGTMHSDWIMGGRYIQSVFKGDFMGMPFEGRSTDGYDNVTKQYVSSWIDNMGTGIMNSTGSCTDGGKVCTMMSEMVDPMSGQKMSIRQVTTWSDSDHFKLEMFGTDPSGHEAKSMEMDATRKGK